MNSAMVVVVGANRRYAPSACNVFGFQYSQMAQGLCMSYVWYRKHVIIIECFY